MVDFVIKMMDFGRRPRLDVFASKKELGKETLHTFPLNDATVAEAGTEKKDTLFTVQDAAGAALLKMKVPTKKAPDEIKAWQARVTKVATPSETYIAAGALTKEEDEAKAAEAKAEKEAQDIVAAQDSLQEKEAALEALKIELVDTEEAQKLVGDDPDTADEVAAEMARLTVEVTAAQAAVEQANVDLQREMAEAAVAAEDAQRERAEADEAKETFSKARTAADEQHVVAQLELAAQQEAEASTRGLALENLPPGPEERRGYLLWLFEHKYDHANRGSIETEQVEHLLYDLAILPHNRAVQPLVYALLDKDGGFRDETSPTMLANVAHQEHAIQDAALLIEKEGKSGFMARNLELKTRDDLRNLPPEDPTRASLKQQLTQAAAELHAADEREAVAKRAKIYAEEELRKATAAIEENRITFAEFDPWFSVLESELYEGNRPVQVFSADIQSAIMHFKACDEELVGACFSIVLCCFSIVLCCFCAQNDGFVR